MTPSISIGSMNFFGPRISIEFSYFYCQPTSITSSDVPNENIGDINVGSLPLVYFDYLALFLTMANILFFYPIINFFIWLLFCPGDFQRQSFECFYFCLFRISFLTKLRSVSTTVFLMFMFVNSK